MSGEERTPGSDAPAGGEGLDWSHLRSPLDGLPPLSAAGSARGEPMPEDEVVVPPPPPAREPNGPAGEQPPGAAAGTVGTDLPPYARATSDADPAHASWSASPAASFPEAPAPAPMALPPAPFDAAYQRPTFTQGAFPNAHPYPGASAAFAYPGVPSRPRPGRGMAVAALTLGIIAGLVAVVPVLGFVASPIAIAAAVLAIVALARRAEGKGVSVSALIISVVAFFLPSVMTFVWVGVLTDSFDSDGGPAPIVGEVPEAQPAWTVTAADLRSGEDGIELLRTVDGSSEDAMLVEAGETWAVITAAVDDGYVPSAPVLHGLDAETGEEHWRRESGDIVRCARQPMGGALVCAEATLTGGAPERFRLVTLDAASGDVIAETSVDAVVSAVAVSGDTVVVVDEPIDRPSVRVLGFSRDLDPTWSVDLSAESNQQAMFSDGSLVWRHEPWRDSPGLDRPRLRHVGSEGGIFALWAGQATAFIDVAAGELIGMPRCSRLVDDGDRLWCNEGDHAAIYSYDLERLGQTPDGQRLVFPRLADYRDSDVSPALTSREDGVLMRPDPQTGEVGDPLIDMGLGDAFGMEIQPTAYTSQGRTYLSGGEGLARLSDDGTSVDWTAEGLEPQFAPFEVDGRLYAAGVRFEESFADVATIDPADGSVVGEADAPLEASELHLTPAGRIAGLFSTESVGRYDDLP